MSKVLDFDPTRRRPTGEPEAMRLYVDPDHGALVLKLTGAPKYGIANEVAIDALERLLPALRRAQYRKFGLPAGPPPERAETRPKRVRCRRRRDGGRHGGPGGCRRLRGVDGAPHAGQCRDADGNYTPAVCSHIGFGRCRVTDLSGAPGAHNHYRCQNCNEEIGPA